MPLVRIPDEVLGLLSALRAEHGSGPAANLRLYAKIVLSNAQRTGPRLHSGVDCARAPPQTWIYAPTVRRC